MNCHEEVEWLFSSDFTAILSRLFSSHLTYIKGWSCSVMTISNVSAGNLLELCLEEIGILNWAQPQYVLSVIVAVNYSVWVLCNCYFHHFLFNSFTILKCQENWPEIGVLSVAKFSAIFFFLFNCQLMSLDKSIFVILDRCHAYDTILLSITHFLHINVHSWLTILNYIAFFTE